MSLSPNEWAAVCVELNAALPGAIVQKAYATNPRRCYLELRQPGRSTLLCVSVEPGVARLSVSNARPAHTGEVPPLQRVLRQQLIGARLTAVEGWDREARFRFILGDLPLLLRARLEGGGHLELRRGKQAGEAVTDAVLGAGQLVLAREAEERFAERVGQKDAATAQKSSIGPLRKERAALERTITKVRAEADRQPKAEEHQRLGELLSRNLNLLERGAKEIRVTDYRPDGPHPVTVPLDPERSPAEQVAGHFKEAKRLLRGSALAAQRLNDLVARAASLEQRIAAAESAQPAAVARPAPAKKLAARLPFREYPSHGERIWVGKDGRSNDALTFKHAKPYHVWFHARGVPGSHVVVALGRNAVLAQEVLLDAAHLALHFSQAKGEPRGEVAYTQVKYVRHVKGGAPGQVTYSQEKTFVVRVETERLARLTARPRLDA